MISAKQNVSVTNGFYQRIIIGVTAALVISAVVALIGPIFILNEYLEPTSVHILMSITQGIGVFIGGLIAGSNVDQRKWLSVGISTCLFDIVLISGGVLFFDSDLGKVIAGLLSTITGAICALVLLNRKKKPAKRKRIKYRSR